MRNNALQLITLAVALISKPYAAEYLKVSSDTSIASAALTQSTSSTHTASLSSTKTADKSPLDSLLEFYGACEGPSKKSPFVHRTIFLSKEEQKKVKQARDFILLYGLDISHMSDEMLLYYL
jgi:hypothetical protein